MYPRNTVDAREATSPKPTPRNRQISKVALGLNTFMTRAAIRCFCHHSSKIDALGSLVLLPVSSTAYNTDGQGDSVGFGVDI